MTGNKMDTTNIATLFAPSLMHTFKDEGVKPASSSSSGGQQSHADLVSQSAASHSDHVSVLRLLIDKRDVLFELPSVELHDVYLYLQDHFPEVLDALLRRRSALAGLE